MQVDQPYSRITRAYHANVGQGRNHLIQPTEEDLVGSSVSQAPNSTKAVMNEN
jgi:hypothetical protein